MAIYESGAGVAETTMSGLEYRCRAGETWDLLALKLWGNEKHAPELMLANPLLAGVSVFKGGEKVQIPVVDAADPERDTNYSPATAPWRTRR